MCFFFGVCLLFGIWHCYDKLCEVLLCVNLSIQRVDVAMCLVLFGHSVQFRFGYVVGQMNVFIVIAHVLGIVRP